MSDPNASIPHLFGNAIEQLGKLFANEVQLAKAELAQKVALAGKGAALLAGAALACIPTLVMLLITLAAYFSQQGFSPVVANLIAAGVGLATTLFLAIAGMSYFKTENLKLKVTTGQLERDLAVAKELTK